MSNLPENVGAVTHPQNKNYIMFSTFDGSSVENSDAILDMPEYQETIKKMVTVMEYENFQAITEAVEGDMGEKRAFHLPQTIQKLSNLKQGFRDMILNQCEDYGEDTYTVLRFFEHFVDDAGQEGWHPVHVHFEEDGSLAGQEEE